MTTTELPSQQTRLIAANTALVQLDRAISLAEFEIAAVLARMRELRDADAVDVDHAVEFTDLITSVGLIGNSLVAARMKAADR